MLDDEHRSDGWLDYPLSDEGRIGLIDAQQYLKVAPIKHVYASSLRRTAETAHILTSGILSHPDVITDDRVKTWNLGMLMGAKKRPNKPIVRYFMHHPDQTPEGGESMEDFCVRFLPAMVQRIKQVEAGDGPVLVVTSGSNLRELGRAFTGSIDSFDLDESGLMGLFISPDGDIQGRVLLGHKTDKGRLDS